MDYETDSLERLEPNKRKSSHSSSSPSSDVSSQLSPSLSTALPLEEEMEISHTVYDRLDGFRKDGEMKKRLASGKHHQHPQHPVQQQRQQKEAAARIKYDTPFRGSMTIEVEHEPPSDLERTDSDQFEPDTLDRKPKKQSFCDISAWDGHKSMDTDFNQINSLPDLSRQQMMSPVPNPAAIKPRTASFILRSSNSFRNLREIYESPLVAQQESCKCEKKPTPEEEGRILTLEAKHSRRQRGMGMETSPTHSVVDITKVNKTTITISSPKLEKPAAAPPPPRPKASNQHYCPPLVQASGKRPLPPPPPPSSAEQQHHPEEDAYSLHSEVTEVTGVSEFDNNTMSSAISATTEERSHTKGSSRAAAAKMGGKVQDEDYEGMYSKKINSLRNDYSLTKYLNRRKSQREEGSKGGQDPAPKEAPDPPDFASNKNLKDVDLVQFDALSVSSRSNRSSGHLSERTKEMYRNAGVPVGIAYPQRAASSSGGPNSGGNVQTTVYRCEIEQAQLTAGMQIAIGLKDRAKKAKDLKNAWRKFVTMAANKFSPSQSPAPTYGSKTAAGFLEDDGIASIIEDAVPVQPGSQTYYEQRFGQLDSGYMSTDSTELYKRNVYDRYNFKMLSGGRGQVIRVDTIEDNDEEESGPNDSRFEDLEHMVSPGHSRRSPDTLNVVTNGDLSDADSDKTLTRSHSQTNSQELNVRGSTTTMSSYSSDENGGRGHSTCCGSSETDEETNAEDMWESGAESIETHSVLYKMIRKS